MEENDRILLQELTQARAVPGNEEEARHIFRKYAEQSADTITYDGLGSIIAEKKGTEHGPKIMFAGHLDEVGFMVKAITDKGFLKFLTLGGWWSQVLLGKQVEIKTGSGQLIHGVIGCKPPHVLTKAARQKAYKLDDMFIDIGATSKQEAEEWGIRPGDMIVPYAPFKQMNNSKFWLAKAWDNRIGTAVALKVLENLKEIDHPNDVFAVGNVQEEVGLRGAKTAAHKIQPDISFALDTGTAGDTPGMKQEEADSELGKGPQIIIYDHSMIAHKGLRDFVVGVAEELDIPFQYTSIPGGGTDAGSQHVSGEGVPSLAITIATRYLHSHSSIIHEDDFTHTVKLVTELMKRLDRKTVDRIVLS